MAGKGKKASAPQGLEKSPTGIRGLDEIMYGGLPKGRPTLVCGSAGCGKTLLSAEFLVRGATQFGEPGVFMSFEETGEELTENMASLGFDLDDLSARNLISLDYVHVEKSEIEETGDYDLEGLFIRLGYAIDSIGAKRVVLDTLEALFGGLSNEAVLRAELRRLFRWLKDKGVTAIITAERGQGGAITRQGLEEYVSDCVILLDHRVTEQMSTRRMRIVKYRGSVHGTNEYPFLIDDKGISILPITSLGLNHEALAEWVSTGVSRLDEMLEGKGYYRGGTVLISGTSGTGKTSLTAHFAEATCRGGERCLYFAFEESPSQIMRNMRSIGIKLEPWVSKGLLRFHAMRPNFAGLEMHLVLMINLVEEFKPAAVIIDPITDFLNIGNRLEVKSMLTRLVDFLKTSQITTLVTSLTAAGDYLEQSESGLSSLVDTWLLLRDIEVSGERNRGLYVLKSRGMAHSNQIREYLLTSKGLQLLDAYVGPGDGGVLTGSARVAQEGQDRAAELERKQEVERLKLGLERKRKAMEAQIAALRADFEAGEHEVNKIISQEQQRRGYATEDLARMARSRKATVSQDGANRKEEQPDG
jgi:circadian clock protein KaiC